MIDHAVALEAEVESLRDAVAAGRDQQRDFVRRAGHDLAAPLRGLRSLTSFLREDAASSLDDDALTLLDRIDRRVVQMEGLVTSLATYGRSNDVETATTPIELTELVEDAIGAAAPPAGFTLDIQASPGVVHLPLASATRCLEHIVENTWHHHVATDGAVSIVAYCADGFAVFVVADDGPGIDDATAARALEPFCTGPASPLADGQRSGMGLAVASTTAAAHGGSVAITRHDRSGTTVEMRWPLSCPLPLA